MVGGSAERDRVSASGDVPLPGVAVIQGNQSTSGPHARRADARGSAGTARHCDAVDVDVSLREGVGVDHVQPRDNEEVAMIGEQFVDNVGRHPLDLVHFFIGSKLAVAFLHCPVSDASVASPAIAVDQCWQLRVDGAPEASFFAYLADGARQG